MLKKYPNLDLIEYKFHKALEGDGIFIERVDSLKQTEYWSGIDFTVQVFLQVWGSTGTGFDVDAYGHPCLSGSAITPEYTTVIHEESTDFYGVFFGNDLCYLVYDASETFFEDLKEKNMKSRYYASLSY